jgi:hypothetical protein
MDIKDRFTISNSVFGSSWSRILSIDDCTGTITNVTFVNEEGELSQKVISQ